MKVEHARIGDILELKRRQVNIVAEETYREVGVRSFARGLFIKDARSGLEIGDKRVFHIHPGDLVVSNIFAWEGAVAVAGEEHVGTIGSHRFMTWTPRSGDVEIGYLSHYFASEEGLSQLQAASPGSAGRNRTLSIKNFEAITVPLPSLPDQRRIAAHLDSVASYIASMGALERDLAQAESAWLANAFTGFADHRPLVDLASVSRGSTPKLAPDGAPFIGQAAVRWGHVDLTRAKFADPEWLTGVRVERLTREGDVLVNSTGEGTIGRTALVTRASAGRVTDSKVLTLRSTTLLPDFLALFLRSPQGRAAVEAAKGANTTKQTELGVARISLIATPAPPLAEQADLTNAWATTAPLLNRLGALRASSTIIRDSLLPSARNEVFSALR